MSCHHILPVALAIGFERAVYFVNESSGFVEVCAMVTSGTLDMALSPLSINYTDGEAVGESDTRKLWDEEIFSAS